MRERLSAPMSVAIDLVPSRAPGSLYLRIGGAIVALYVTIAVIGPIIAPYSADEQDLLAALDPPSLAHLFGTDPLGRDVEAAEDVRIAATGRQEEHAQVAKMDRGRGQLVGGHGPGESPGIEAVHVGREMGSRE